MPDFRTVYPGVQGSPVPNDVRAVRDTGFIPPVEDRGRDLPRIVQVPAPEITPPVGSVDVIVQVQASTNVAGEVKTLASFALQHGFILLLRAVDLFIDDMVQATDIAFTLFVDQGPYPGFSNVKIFPGVAARAGKTLDQTVLRMRGPCTVSITATNNDGGAHLIGAGFQGYSMTEETYRQYGGAGF